MGENGRVDLIVKQLDRIETKLDAHLKDTADKFSRMENRVTRIEVIGGTLQGLWATLAAFFGKGGGYTP